MVEIIKNPPKAQDFMEASRSFGNYDLALSLADLIDNSITAKATEINIFASYDSKKVHVLDNGLGMNKEKLIDSMRMASRNPKTENESNDLGRFGLGLKTASFSQCSCLNVFTFDGLGYSGAEWDLDDCDDFTMKVFAEEEVKNSLHNSFKQDSGTEIIWSKLTRLIESNHLTREDFNSLIINATNEISLIFHRYLKGNLNNKKQISISINGTKLEAIDPFYSPSAPLQTQVFEPEYITFKKKQIKVQLYVLPHFSKLSKKDSDNLAGKEGYVKNSGFYIYRENRLIIRGTWFKLFPHGELSKLARVLVDIPNSLDNEWKITVDKSEAQLPTALKSRLTGLIKNTYSIGSKKVFQKTSVTVPSNENSNIWKQEVKNDGSSFFSINYNYPLIKNTLKTLSKDDKKQLNSILSLIEKGLPLDTIHSLYSDNPENFYQGYTTEEPVELGIEYFMYQKEKGVRPETLIEQLEAMHPFSEYIDKIKLTLNKRKLI